MNLAGGILYLGGKHLQPEHQAGGKRPVFKSQGFLGPMSKLVSLSGPQFLLGKSINPIPTLLRVGEGSTEGRGLKGLVNWHLQNHRAGRELLPASEGRWGLMGNLTRVGPGEDWEETMREYPGLPPAPAQPSRACL